VGFAPGPETIAADPPRHSPELLSSTGHHVAVLISLEIKDRRAQSRFSRSGGVHDWGPPNEQSLVGDTGTECAATGPASLEGSDHSLYAARHSLSDEEYGDRLASLFAEGDAFHEIWRADGWRGGDEGWPTTPFQVHVRLTPTA